MTNSIIELHMQIPADLEGNISGQFDEHLKLIERTLNVTLISRDGMLKILGTEQSAGQARKLMEELVELAKRGNTITRQNVNYALSLAMEERNQVLTEIDKDFICNTIQGRPIKPKTLGQKEYVDQIRQKMIVFGVGPAGTGKTYLAMAMAVTAFRNEEVSRIILTRPAIEAGEKLGFLPGDLQSKEIRIFDLCMMLFIRSWELTVLPKIWKEGSLKWHLWHICEDGHWIMPLLSWTRHRTPHLHR